MSYMHAVTNAERATEGSTKQAWRHACALPLDCRTDGSTYESTSGSYV